MDWAKRNLFFLIGGLAAVLLLGGAGFYLYQNFSERSVSKQKLDESYARLADLTSMNPGPGDGGKVDNIGLAKEHQTNLLAFIQRSSRFFEPIAPIPNSTNVNSPEFTALFAAELRNTIGQMQRSATNASVQLPPECEFSFRAIKKLISFAPGSLQPLSVQLGEVKAIGDVLFKAKINSLEGLRRERVSADDTDPTDHIEEHSITNDIAVISPYEITFRCFSTELATVLSGFANSPHCFMVKSVTIIGGAQSAATPGGGPSPGFAPPQPASPFVTPSPGAVRGGGRSPGYEDVYLYDVTQTVLDEQPLQVTLKIVLVKPITVAK